MHVIKKYFLWLKVSRQKVYKFYWETKNILLTSLRFICERKQTINIDERTAFLPISNRKPCKIDFIHKTMLGRDWILAVHTTQFLFLIPVNRGNVFVLVFWRKNKRFINSVIFCWKMKGKSAKWLFLYLKNCIALKWY